MANEAHSSQAVSEVHISLPKVITRLKLSYIMQPDRFIHHVYSTVHGGMLPFRVLRVLSFKC